jgi:hypothetical protein
MPQPKALAGVYPDNEAVDEVDVDEELGTTVYEELIIKLSRDQCKTDKNKRCNICPVISNRVSFVAAIFDFVTKTSD